MSFDTTAGTRGGKLPKGGGLYGWFQKRMVGRIRRKGVKMRGQELLVLTTIGAKSGEARSTPVMFFPEDDGSRLIVASANGAARNPAWYHNIAAHPDRVRIEVAGEQQSVTATQLDGEDRARAWAAIKAASSGFAGYESKTDREIPVIRLTPTA